jgi:RNA polymerase sigma-70 factor, ECF subfamily
VLKRSNYSPQTEEDFIRKAQKDSRYFGPIYSYHFDSIFRFIFKKTAGNEALTDDLTQLCFIKAMNSIAKYEFRGYPFSAWLYRIALNELNMYYRASKRNKYTEIQVNEMQVNEIFIALNDTYSTQNQEDIEKLVENINLLEDSNKDILELRFFEQMSFKQIGEILQISEANAKMKVYRILEKIKSNWNKPNSTIQE